MAKITINVSDEKLDKTIAGIEDPSEALKAIGALFTVKAQRSFREQKRGSISWAPRGVPNVAGIIGDFNKGQNPKARRFQARPAMIDTGRLRGSISWVVSGNGVTIGTNVPYARKLQEGIASTVSLTFAGRQKLRQWYRGQSKRKRKEFGKEMGWLFRKTSITVTPSARPFLTIEDQDVKEVMKLVKERVINVSK